MILPRFSLAAGCLALGAACASSGPAEPPAPIQARVSRVFPRTTGLDTSVFEVNLEVYNPRASAVEVRGIQYSLDTGDVAGVVEGSVDVAATLAAEQQAKLGFKVEIPLPQEPSTLKELIAQDVVPANLSGEIAFGDGSRSAFSKKSGLALPSLPKFIVHDAQAAQYERKRVDVTFFLRLVNENAFALTVQSVTYTVWVDGKEMQTEQGGVGTRLMAGAAEEYEVALVFDQNSYKELDKLVASGVLDYQVVGEVTTPALTIPFDHRGKIDLGASE